MPVKKLLAAACLALFTVVACAAAQDWPTTPLVDPNTASEEDLAAISALGAEGAKIIVDNRPFTLPRELDAALSATMDEEALREVYMHVFMTVDLNTAAEEDLKLIPSSLSARKLAHEVEEYRPYASVEQFEREMSKYVSDKEVAYLKRYVYLAE